MPAALDDLCTLAELKAQLVLQSNNDDALLQVLITNLSLQIAQWANRTHFLAASFGNPNTIIFDGNGADVVLLADYPITAITSVSVGGVLIPACVTDVDNGWLTDLDKRVLLRGYTFCRGRRNCRIVATLGYAAVPIDLKQAAIDVIAWAYKERIHLGITSESANGQVTVSYSKDAIPRRAATIIQNYTRRHMRP